jgi:predicted nuclease of restriction endonuclease-like (RecB) superfamily
LLAEVKARIQSAQYAALRAVNQELVGLYWDIGRLIVERQESEGWGKAVVAQLARDLQADYPGTGGFSASNLWRMKGFFETYSALEKLAPLVREIGWSHNLVILERCKDAQQREFYLRMTRKFGWSKNVLAHQIDNQSYEKSLLGQTNFDQTLTPALRAQAKLAVKDEYAFDFLELGEQHSERELERSLIARIEDFLRAMGGMFAFMGSQYRVEVEGKEYFIDLLLFHRRLRALVAIELKIGEFEPEFVGKMQFYLAALDAQVRQADENPAIGIILCKEKTRTIVEYALRDARKPIGVATYEITRTLPRKLKDQLPSPEAIARLLESI